jgi:hypothetical protein
MNLLVRSFRHFLGAVYYRCLRYVCLLDATLPRGHGFTAIRGHAPKVIHKGTEMGKGHVLHSFVFVLVARFCKLLVFLSSAYGVLFKCFYGLPFFGDSHPTFLQGCLSVGDEGTWTPLPCST